LNQDSDFIFVFVVHLLKFVIEKNCSLKKFSGSCQSFYKN